MLTFVKSISKPSYKCKKAEAEKKRVARERAKPTPWQFNRMSEIVCYLKRTRYQRRERVYNYLREHYGVEVVERRMYKFGGVGSTVWHPRLRCFRIQAGAGHINRKGAWLNYADCIEIYEFL